jgi:hypothetical protein
MSLSDTTALPPSSDQAVITLTLAEDEDLIIRKAAELQGWSVTEYVRAALLDRAERDLYERAAMADWEPVFPATSAEPITSLLGVFSTR